jgi:hypothetical protein
VTWEDHRLARERVKPGPDGLFQIFVRTTRKICSSNRADKKRVAREDHPVREQTHSARRMAGRMDDLKSDIADSNRVSVLDQDVCRRRLYGAEHVQHFGRCTQEQRGIGFVNDDFGSGTPDHFPVSHRMIDVVMGVHDVPYFQSMRLSFSEKHVVLIRWIYEQSLFGLFVSNEITEDCEIPHFVLSDKHNISLNVISSPSYYAIAFKKPEARSKNDNLKRSFFFYTRGHK